jgi:hypothetical protein
MIYIHPQVSKIRIDQGKVIKCFGLLTFWSAHSNSVQMSRFRGKSVINPTIQVSSSFLDIKFQLVEHTSNCNNFPDFPTILLISL